jgi:hypothetical protein
LVVVAVSGAVHAQLIQPLDQFRSLDVVVQATTMPESSMVVSADFDTFDDFITTEVSESRQVDGTRTEEVSAFALAAQRSTIAPNQILAFGTVAGTSLDASWASPRYDAQSHFDVTFRVDAPVSFSLSAAIQTDGFETSGSVSLSGSSGQRFAGCVGAACNPAMEPAGATSLDARGILAAGEYRLQAHLSVQAQLPISSEGEYAVRLQVAPLPVAFHPISSIQSNTGATDFWPVSNLIQGSGVGFQAAAPFEKSATGSGGNWVTAACGFPCDYFATNDPPVLIVDLGQDQPLFEMDVWGYENTNANGASQLRLRFASAADGLNGFGTSIDYEPTFGGLTNETDRRQPLVFDQTVHARYVEITASDNFFVAPGNGSQGETPGGDRVGLGEIAFPAPIPGDFNYNGFLDVQDVDQLTSRIAAGVAPQARFDLNQDGAINVVDLDVWVKDLAETWIGDVNLDGVFTSSDFVQVFTAGRFETGQLAKWSEGDWNADGIFSSRDFITAFTDGGFEQGPRASVAAVPEPTTAWLLAAGVVVSLRRCRHAK